MCGIAGAFFLRDEGLVDRFARAADEALAHRGPDDFGSLRVPEGVLVHRRLSILDPTLAGHQPFRSANGTVHLIHNGEIYNYLELREELRALGCSFATDTDTEVIVAAYGAWGLDALARFNGIWAFALWDSTRRTLVLSRDRLGVKPLYVARVAGGVAFASEIKGLTSIVPGRRPNPSALRDYARDVLIDHADATFIEGIHPVPPGTSLLLSDGEEQLVRYWSLDRISSDSDPRPRPDDAERLVELGALFRSAVGLQLRSDVPLGSCLSGGLDSSGIVATTSRLLAERTADHEARPRIALTASFPGSDEDETARARSVADAAGVIHRAVALEPGDLLETLDEVLGEQDEPFLSGSILAQRSVMRAAAAEGLKVMLDGQGADELLAGYPHYRYAWLLGIARRHPWAAPRALQVLRRWGIPPGVAIRQAALAQLQLGDSGRSPVGGASRPPVWLGPTLRRTEPLPLRGGSAPSGTPLARHLWRAVVSTSLPALLRYEDRDSMRFGVEARVPYLDHRLVEAALQLPDRLKMDRGWTKVALREILRGDLDDAIRLDRRKIGFAVPQAKWLERSRSAVRSSLLTSPAIDAGYLDRGGLEQLLDRPVAVDGGSQLWRALSVDRWVRQLS